MNRRLGRRGFALPVVLAALVLLTALVAGMLFIATEELRAGRTDVTEEQALAVAELALHRGLADPRLRGNSFATIAVGATVELGTPSAARPESELEPVPAGTGQAETTVRATRVSERLAWIVARAVVGGDASPLAVRRTVAAAMRVLTPHFAPSAALTARGSVMVTAGATVDGTDSVTEDPAERCAAATADVAGVAVPDTLRVCDGSCPTPAAPAIVGTPSRLASPAADDSATYERFGIVARERLAAAADVVLESGVYTPAPASLGDACDRARSSNWGDPNRSSPCADYLPVIHVRGDVTLAAGSLGQGILIADGDVTFEPAARFVGVVVARDDVVLRGAGATIVGAAWARDIDGSDATHIDLGAAVRYSGCAVHRAAVAASRLARVGGHWWAELR